jgi:inorganic pyrophosphatase
MTIASTLTKTMESGKRNLGTLLSMVYKAHPWHGISSGRDVPKCVTAYIEIVPTDAMKYELDKPSGHLRIDRPQRFSSMCPVPYGLIPRTYCGELVAEFSAAKTGRSGIVGDGDPLDICVLTERSLTSGNVLLEARPIGGLRMIDTNQADDKIIAVLIDDAAYGDLEDISECAPKLIGRLEHYFLSYKQSPSEESRRVEITEIFGNQDAFEVIRRSQEDYLNKFGDPIEQLNAIGADQN